MGLDDAIVKKILSFSIKALALKSLAFLILWSVALYSIFTWRPDLIEWPKLVTNTFANMFAFWLGYILTILGFRYSRKDRKK